MTFVWGSKIVTTRIEDIFNPLGRPQEQVTLRNIFEDVFRERNASVEKALKRSVPSRYVMSVVSSTGNS